MFFLFWNIVRSAFSQSMDQTVAFCMRQQTLTFLQSIYFLKDNALAIQLVLGIWWCNKIIPVLLVEHW